MKISGLIKVFLILLFQIVLLSVCDCFNRAYSQNNFFRVLNGIPHLPVLGNSSLPVSPSVGMLIFNSDVAKPMVYTGATNGWKDWCSYFTISGSGSAYFKVENGIPFVSVLAGNAAPAPPAGMLYYSSSMNKIMVSSGTSFMPVEEAITDHDRDPLAWGRNESFASIGGEYRMMQIPVVESLPGNVAEGAVLMNKGRIMYFENNKWQELICPTVPSIYLEEKITDIILPSAKFYGGVSDGNLPLLEHGLCWKVNDNSSPPVIADSRLIRALPSPYVSSFAFDQMKGALQPNSTYYVRAYAINALGVSYSQVRQFTTCEAEMAGAYRIIRVEKSGQCWLAENLRDWRSDSYIDQSNTTGSTLQDIPGWGTGTNQQNFGRLYMWSTNSLGSNTNFSDFTLRIQSICPEGYAIPSYNDLEALKNALISSGYTWHYKAAWDIARLTLAGFYQNWYQQYFSGQDPAENVSSEGFYISTLKRSNTINQVATLHIPAFPSNYVQSIGMSYKLDGLEYMSVRCIKNDYLPSLSMPTASSVSYSSAFLTGAVNNQGANAVTSRGFCYNTSGLPTKGENTITVGSGTGSFSSNISGLTSNTTYYVRAWATNAAGTGYSPQFSFTTAPAVGDSYQGGIVFYSDQPFHGLIASNPPGFIGEWGCLGRPIPSNIALSDSRIGVGQENTTLIIRECPQPLLAAELCDSYVSGGYSDWFLPSADELNQLYTQRFLFPGFAYADYWNSTQFDRTSAWIQNFNTGLRSQLNKDAVANVWPIRAFGQTPVITTDNVVDIRSDEATVEGNFTETGNATIVERGICFSLTPNPVIGDAKVVSSRIALEKFKERLTGLLPSTRYYTRAYVISSIGTVYGKELQFDTN